MEPVSLEHFSWASLSASPFSLSCDQASLNVHFRQKRRGTVAQRVGGFLTPLASLHSSSSLYSSALQMLEPMVSGPPLDSNHTDG